MISELFLNPISFLVWIAALLIAITIHEFSHALIADRLGDPTPRLMGRLTLNPLAHLDPIGTLFLLLVRFGWGKPVQIDPFNLKDPRRDQALISLAGPSSNLILAALLALFLRLPLPYPFFLVGLFLFKPLIQLNVILAIFNLLPIHPLDGFSVVLGFLPAKHAVSWQELERYGFIFLLFLLFPFPGGPYIINILGPILSFLLSLLLPGFRI